MGKQPERARFDLGERLMDAFETCALEFVNVSEGGVEMIISTRQAAYLRELLGQQSDPQAEGLLSLLEADTEPLAAVIPLQSRSKGAGQGADPGSYAFWYDEQRAE